MLKLISNLSRRGLVLGALALCLTTTTAWALTVQAPFLFPDVDSFGDLYYSVGTPGFVNVNVNTNNGKFKASGKAQVQNESNFNLTYKNPSFNIPNFTVKSSRYSVKRSGAASVAASGMAAL